MVSVRGAQGELTEEVDLRELTRSLLDPETVLSQPNGRQALAEMLQDRVLELRDIERTAENQNYLDRVQRGYSWLWKSYAVESESDLEARFLFAWVAFNALYGVRRDWLDRNRPKRAPNHGAAAGITDLEWFLWKVANLVISQKLSPRGFSILFPHP